MSDWVLFDTTAYIQSFRSRAPLPSLVEVREDVVVYFSSVVAEELYIGAADPERERRINILWYSALEMQRLITPSAGDWRAAGLLLEKVRRRYGSERVARGRLTNDALIALSAKEHGLTVLTANQGDFATLREFLDFDFRRFELTP